jgi:hypothetical protein
VLLYVGVKGSGRKGRVYTHVTQSQVTEKNICNHGKLWVE